MGASNDTKLGLALQLDGTTVNETHAAFNYFTFAEGSMGVNNMVVPAEDGIGTGGFPSAVEKMGVHAQGGLEGVAHAKSIGMLLYGILGVKAAPVVDGAGFHHTFSVHATDKLVLPYFTVRQYNPTISTTVGEVFPHTRLAGLSLSWKAADYRRVQVAFMGTLGGAGVDITPDDWAPTVDLGPTFIAPRATIAGFASPVKVISGGIQFGADIPLDNQWITGSYTPDAMDVVKRSAQIQMVIKVTDMALYKKFSYDPAGGATWVASAMKEGGVTMTFESSQTYDALKPYKLAISFDNVSENVVWTAQPLSIRAGQPVTLAITGTVVGSGASEITADLYNKTSKYDPAGF